MKKQKSKTRKPTPNTAPKWKILLGTALFLLGLTYTILVFSWGSPIPFVSSLLRPDTNEHFAVFAFINYLIPILFAITVIITGIYLVKHAKISSAILYAYPILITILFLNRIAGEFIFYRHIDCVPVSEYGSCPIDNRPLGIFLLGLAVYTAGIITAVLIRRHLQRKSK